MVHVTIVVDSVPLPLSPIPLPFFPSFLSPTPYPFRRLLRRLGTRDEPPRTSAWEAKPRRHWSPRESPWGRGHTVHTRMIIAFVGQ